MEHLKPLLLFLAFQLPATHHHLSGTHGCEHPLYKVNSPAFVPGGEKAPCRQVLRAAAEKDIPLFFLPAWSRY